jgi:hypothetical protein
MSTDPAFCADHNVVCVMRLGFRLCHASLAGWGAVVCCSWHALLSSENQGIVDFTCIFTATLLDLLEMRQHPPSV